MQVSSLLCPLCQHGGHQFYHQDNNKRTQRIYLRCQQCQLVFVPAEFYLSAEDEKAEYDLHENNVLDDGYRRFLERFWLPLKSKLKPNSHILDFGCGPGPLLGQMMQEDGFHVSLYDHFYHHNPEVLKPNFYDAISTTEVIEHLHQPCDVFKSWLNWIKPGGYLAVMTKLVTTQAAFTKWHYKNDLTHVCFYSEATFAWLANRYGLHMTRDAQDVTLFRLPSRV